MANIRAVRNGTWGDTDVTTSPWGTAGNLYMPSAGDYVFSNGYTIVINSNINVNTITNMASTVPWVQNTAINRASTVGGSFTLSGGPIVTANIVVGTTAASCVTLSNEESAKIVGNVSINSTGSTTGHGISHNSLGSLIVNGSVTGTNAAGAQYGIEFSNVGNLYVIVLGNITGGTGASTRAIRSSNAGFLTITGNIAAADTGTQPAVEATGSGITSFVGSIKASANANGFVSTNSSSINRISGNLINFSSNGIQAVHAYSYLFDPVPVNGIRQDVGVYWPLKNPSNRFDSTNSLTMYNAYSLSAFSMPPVSSVRLGVSYANGQLIGALTVPTQAMVQIDIPVDHTVGRAAFRILDFFNVSVARLTAENSIGNVLGNLLTTSCIGETLASWD